MGSCDHSVCHKDVSLVRFTNKFRFPDQSRFTSRTSTFNSNECRFKLVTSLWNIENSSYREDFYQVFIPWFPRNAV